MNFLDAKKIVSPDKPVVPGSQAHKDILILMRQSGHIFAEDNVPAPMITAKTARDFIPRERKHVEIRPTPLSKKKLFTGAKSLASLTMEFPSSIPAPGMSKKQWLGNLKITPVIISNGPTIGGEQVQTDGET
jgi:hypothetical protein